MTEAEARGEVARLVDAPVLGRLDRLVELVVAENERQNLIARSTVPSIWQRHVLDSVQLVALAPVFWNQWLDIGTGGGFPGLAVACVRDLPMTLAEPRGLRAAFLHRAAVELGLSQVVVEVAKVERLTLSTDVISARAVASTDALLRQAGHCAKPATRWLLPKGSLIDDLDGLRRQHPTMMFHVEHSRSDPASVILVADGRP